MLKKNKILQTVMVINNLGSVSCENTVKRFAQKLRKVLSQLNFSDTFHRKVQKFILFFCVYIFDSVKR